MILYIDTTDYNSVTFKVKTEKKVLKKTYQVDPHKAFETLGKLEEFLKTINYKLKTINSLVVNKGPGSYTGTRVGAAHALAISLALNIPVKFLEKDKFEKELGKK
jgi:tRNA threonylcarbamoyladenosine biosynthesis protein TsaB